MMDNLLTSALAAFGMQINGDQLRFRGTTYPVAELRPTVTQYQVALRHNGRVLITIDRADQATRASQLERIVNHLKEVERETNSPLAQAVAKLETSILKMDKRVDDYGRYCTGITSSMGRIDDAYTTMYDRFVSLKQELQDMQSTQFTHKNAMFSLIERVVELEKRPKAKAEVPRIVIQKGTEVREIEGMSHPQLPMLIKVLGDEFHAFLVGPSGTGKTFAATQASTAIGHDGLACVYRTHRHSVAGDLFGDWSVDGKYIEGMIYQAVKYGGVALIDEFDNGTPSFVKGLNNLTDTSPIVHFPHEQVEKHPDFRIILTGNTVGQGADHIYTAASAPLDASSLDRVQTITWNIDEDLEEAIGLRFIPDGNDELEIQFYDWLKTVRMIRAWVLEQELGLSVSPRATESGGKMLAKGYTMAQILDLTIRNRMTAEQQADLKDLLHGQTWARDLYAHL